MSQGYVLQPETPGNSFHGRAVMQGDHMTGSKTGRWVYCRYIVKHGRKIYPKKGKCFRFWVDGDSK